ncbi:MAG: hypothetical protein EOP10_06725 [Proteobacteria bacterium]|nr:MAG: hypothetical protein EOP10_06725 [Pseudomonadota bacterium]
MDSLKILLSLITLYSAVGFAKTECYGPKDKAKAYVVYLHGFEDVTALSGEEDGNRALLQRLASEMNLSIALPLGPVCPSKGKRCWPAKNEAEVLATFALIAAARTTCFDNKDYTLVGFSNGGYYAFKLYKAHKDAHLKRIIASSSSGLWNPGKDKVNPLSEFHLMIGDKDITRKTAELFMQEFKKAAPASTLSVFAGGHRMDYATLKKLIF